MNVFMHFYRLSAFFFYVSYDALQRDKIKKILIFDARVKIKMTRVRLNSICFSKILLCILHNKCYF